MNNPGVLILIFGFIFFATLYGGGSKKIEQLEKLATIVSSFGASVFTISGLFLLLTFPIWLLFGFIVYQTRKIIKIAQK